MIRTYFLDTLSCVFSRDFDSSALIETVARISLSLSCVVYLHVPSMFETMVVVFVCVLVVAENISFMSLRMSMSMLWTLCVCVCVLF